MDWNRDGEIDNSELRLTGLILAQSTMVGLAVGVFDSDMWLPAGASGDTWMNGITYAMGALAVQILGFYLFKMFFEGQMKQRVFHQNRQKEYDSRLRGMQSDHDHRRMELELRVQEMQLQKELNLYQSNPNTFDQLVQKTAQQMSPPPLPIPPSGGAMSLGLDNITPTQNVIVPPRNLEGLTPEQVYAWAQQNEVIAGSQIPSQELSQLADELNMENLPLKKDGTPDLRYRKKQ